MIVTMTADELRQLVADVVGDNTKQNSENNELWQQKMEEVNKCIDEMRQLMTDMANKAAEAEWPKGLRGIVKALGVNTDKASKIKNSGVIDEALIYNGPRSFVVNAPKARELWKKHTDNIRMGVV